MAEAFSDEWQGREVECPLLTHLRRLTPGRPMTGVGRKRKVSFRAGAPARADIEMPRRKQETAQLFRQICGSAVEDLEARILLGHELGEHVRNEIAKWDPVVNASGAKPEQ